MDQLVLDGEGKIKLNELDQQRAIVDQTGHAVGMYLPMAAYKQIMAAIPIPFSKEQIERLRQEKGSCSIEEFWKAHGPGMIYTVAMTPSAQDHLADIWVNSSDRPAVTRASHQIDARLRRDPYSDSESRDDVSRVMFVPPLGIAFDVSDDDRLVTIWAVWEID